MPIHPKYKGDRIVGYQWGNHGKVYLISKYGPQGALNKAHIQSRAAHASGYTSVKQHKRKGKKVRKHTRRINQR